jgi:hypothetical protein
VRARVERARARGYARVLKVARTITIFLGSQRSALPTSPSRSSIGSSRVTWLDSDEDAACPQSMNGLLRLCRWRLEPRLALPFRLCSGPAAQVPGAEVPASGLGRPPARAAFLGLLAAIPCWTRSLFFCDVSLRHDQSMVAAGRRNPSAVQDAGRSPGGVVAGFPCGGARARPVHTAPDGTADAAFLIDLHHELDSPGATYGEVYRHSPGTEGRGHQVDGTGSGT